MKRPTKRYLVCAVGASFCTNLPQQRLHTSVCACVNDSSSMSPLIDVLLLFTCEYHFDLLAYFIAASCG